MRLNIKEIQAPRVKEIMKTDRMIKTNIIIIWMATKIEKKTKQESLV